MLRPLHLLIFLLVASMFVVSGCKEREAPQVQPQAEKAAPAPAQPAPAATGTAETPEGTIATSRLQPTEGNNVTGTVTFTRTAEGIEVVADVQGLSPGPHGIHVHEKGDCSAPDASSAGEHFNPEGTPHGAPDNPAAQRHVGDLGNIEAGPDGTARYQRVDQVLTLEGPNSIIGKAVVIHASPDDMTSQPAGNAGPRVACGVIELTPPADDREQKGEEKK